jgi:hypothetical protein
MLRMRARGARCTSRSPPWRWRASMDGGAGANALASACGLPTGWSRPSWTCWRRSASSSTADRCTPRRRVWRRRARRFRGFCAPLAGPTCCRSTTSTCAAAAGRSTPPAGGTPIRTSCRGAAPAAGRAGRAAHRARRLLPRRRGGRRGDRDRALPPVPVAALRRPRAAGRAARRRPRQRGARRPRRACRAARPADRGARGRRAVRARLAAGAVPGARRGAGGARVHVAGAATRRLGADRERRHRRRRPRVGDLPAAVRVVGRRAARRRDARRDAPARGLRRCRWRPPSRATSPA